MIRSIGFICLLICFSISAYGQVADEPDIVSAVTKEFQGDSYSRLRDLVNRPKVNLNDGTVVLKVIPGKVLSESETTEAEQALRSMVRSAKFENWEALADGVKIEIADFTPSLVSEWIKKAIIEESRNETYLPLRNSFDFENSKYELDGEGFFRWTVKTNLGAEPSKDMASLQALLATAIGQRRDVPAGLDIDLLKREASISFKENNGGSVRKAMVFSRLEGASAEQFGVGVHAYFARDYSNALEIFTELVNMGVKDARLMTFLGLTQYQLGMEDAAKEMFAIAAKLEVSGRASQSLGPALERVQGVERQEIELARLVARSMRKLNTTSN
jgi:hypothetical protein